MKDYVAKRQHLESADGSPMIGYGSGNIYVHDDHGVKIKIENTTLLPLRDGSEIAATCEKGLINPIKWKRKGYQIKSAGTYFIEYRNPNAGSIWVIYNNKGEYYLVLDQTKLNFRELLLKEERITFSDAENDTIELADDNSNARDIMVRAARQINPRDKPWDLSILTPQNLNRLRDLMSHHRCHQHVGKDRLKKNLAIYDIEFPQRLFNLIPILCIDCQIVNAQRADYHELPKSSIPLEYIYSDVCTVSNEYERIPNSFTNITDLATGYKYVRPNRPSQGKADAKLAIKWFIAHVERANRNLQKGVDAKHQVVHLITDQGLEFANADISQYCEERGIDHKFATAHQPQQNAVAERANLTILRGICTNLSQAGLPEQYWPWAATHAVNVWNNTYSHKLKMLPVEAIMGTPPNRRVFRPFGCLVIFYDKPPLGGKPGSQPKRDTTHRYNFDNLEGYRKSTKKRKVDPPGSFGIFLGLSPKVLGYAVLELGESRQIHHTRNCDFAVNIFPLNNAEHYARTMVLLNGKTPFKWTRSKYDDYSINWDNIKRQDGIAEVSPEKFDPTTITMSQFPGDPSNYPPPDTPIDETEPFEREIDFDTTEPDEIPKDNQEEPQLLPKELTPDNLPPTDIAAAETDTNDEPEASQRERTPEQAMPEETNVKVPLNLRMDFKDVPDVADISQGRQTRLQAKRPLPKDLDKETKNKRKSKKKRVNLARLESRLKKMLNFDENQLLNELYRETERRFEKIWSDRVRVRAILMVQVFNEALNNPVMKAAFEKEYNAHIERETWFSKPIITKDPKILKKTIGTKWIFHMKPALDELGRYIEIAKARLVALGNLQNPETYDETYAPTLPLEILRLVFAIALAEDFIIEQIDINTAYLNAYLPEEEEVYIRPPLGSNELYNQPNGEKLVHRLNRALYGLKQAGRLWYLELHNYLTKELGFTEALECKSLYIHCTRGKVMIILAVFVDDIIICGRNAEKVRWIKEKLSKYGIKDIGTPTDILKTRIRFNDNKTEMTLDRTRSIEKIADEYNLKPNNVKTPMIENFTVNWEDAKKQVAEFDTATIESRTHLMRRMVGILVYQYRSVRPDIGFAATTLARCIVIPTDEILEATKRVLQYLYNTKDKALKYSFDARTEDNFIAFCDAGFQKEESDDHLTKLTAIGFHINMHGPIHWKTERTKWVCKSTAHAEATALTRTNEELDYLNKIAYFLKKGQLLNDEKPTYDKIFTDNWTLVRQLKDGRALTSTKVRHWETRIHRCYQDIKTRERSIIHVNTENNITDMGTKSLGPRKFLPILDAQFDMKSINVDPLNQHLEVYQG